MSETLLWLVYLVCAGLAYGAVRRLNWPITLATLASTAFGVAAWYAGVQLGKEENEPSWMNVELAINGSFCMIFAAAGAALGMYLAQRSSRADESDPEGL